MRLAVMPGGSCPSGLPAYLLTPPQRQPGQPNMCQILEVTAVRSVTYRTLNLQATIGTFRVRTAQASCGSGRHERLTVLPLVPCASSLAQVSSPRLFSRGTQWFTLSYLGQASSGATAVAITSSPWVSAAVAAAGLDIGFPAGGPDVQL